MSRFVAGFILGFILVPLAVYVYFSAGMAPVATAAAPMPFERTFARMGLRAAVAKLPPAHPPVEAGESVYLQGASIYREQCAVCHGLLQQPAPTPISRGMYPSPPRLFPGKGVSDDPPEETYWKVSNGIRMTGMPAFRDSLTDLQIWQVTLLLANSNQLPPAVQQALAWTANPETPQATKK